MSRTAGPVRDDLRPDGGSRLLDDGAAFLSALLDTLSVGVVGCDAEGTLVVLNRALRDMLRLSVDPAGTQLAGSGAQAINDVLLHPDGRPMAMDESPLLRSLRGERVRDEDVVIKLPGEPSRIFNANGAQVTDRHGARLGALVALHDVTTLRRIGRFRECQQKVMQALAHVRTVAESAPDVLGAVAGSLGWPYAELWLRDEVADTLWQVGTWSSPGLDLADVPDSHVAKGVGVTGTVWATAAPLWVPDIDTSPHCSSEECRPLVEYYLGHRLRTAVAVPILDGGVVLGVLTCFADTPEYQEELITVLLGGVAAQIGQHLVLGRVRSLGRELGRARDDFVALVGHELRTPLTSIAGYSGLLAEDTALDEERRDMVRVIHRNAEAVRAIFDELLLLAGLESGELPIAPRDVDLAVLCAEALAAVRPAAQEHGVRLTADLPHGARVHGDPERLRQVIDNVLSNAIKYSDSPGHVHLGLTHDGRVVELRATDDGIGIPSDERDRLFDRFYRASNVRHQRIPGTGLGLSLVRAIVELHGGSVSLTGRDGPGAIALIRLPAVVDTTEEAAWRG